MGITFCILMEATRRATGLDGLGSQAVCQVADYADLFNLYGATVG